MINDKIKVKKLSIELKKIQKYRKYLYKILSNYLDKLFVGNFNYNDYLITENLKKEIKDLNNQGKHIVKEIGLGVI